MKKLFLAALAISVALGAGAAGKKKNWALKSSNPEFLASDSARHVAGRVLLYQRDTGGWPKNIDMTRPLSPDEEALVRADKARRDDSTTDNGATNLQIGFLARMYKATGDTLYRDAVRRGVDYLLSGQYPSGGWPQFWPENEGYQVHITYNDNAMTNTLGLIRSMMYGLEPYDQPGLLPDGYRHRLMEAFYKGVECILATQIVDADGRLTVWCQQHYRDTYLPAPARAYELPSYCSSESAAILWLLMEIPRPDERIKRAVHAGMRWLDDHRVTGYRYERLDSLGQPDSRLVADEGAGPLWARFYDLEHAEPYVCDRDGIPRRHLEEIGSERRNGYGWYNDYPAALYPKYLDWARLNDPDHMESLSLIQGQE